MKKYISAAYLSLLYSSMLIFLQGCDFIGDIFKAGIWVGIIIIIAILLVIAFIIKMLRE